jgi:hypothetical protein
MDIPIYKLTKSGPIRFPIGYLSDRAEGEEYFVSKKDGWTRIYISSERKRR